MGMTSEENQDKTRRVRLVLSGSGPDVGPGALGMRADGPSGQLAKGPGNSKTGTARSISRTDGSIYN